MHINASSALGRFGRLLWSTTAPLPSFEKGQREDFVKRQAVTYPKTPLAINSRFSALLTLKVCLWI